MTEHDDWDSRISQWLSELPHLPYPAPTKRPFSIVTDPDAGLDQDALAKRRRRYHHHQGTRAKLTRHRFHRLISPPSSTSDCSSDSAIVMNHDVMQSRPLALAAPTSRRRKRTSSDTGDDIDGDSNPATRFSSYISGDGGDGSDNLTNTDEFPRLEDAADHTPRGSPSTTTSLQKLRNRLSAPPSKTSSRRRSEVSFVSDTRTTTSTGSNRFRLTSSQRQLHMLNFSGAVSTRELSRTEKLITPQMKKLLNVLSPINKPAKLIPESFKAEINTLVANGSIDEPVDSVFDASGERLKLGPPPDIRSVNKVLVMASKCRNNQKIEDAWVTTVIYPLLELCVYGSFFPDQNLLGIELCTSARVGDLYRLDDCKTGRMVDLCVTINPAELPGGPAAVAAINEIIKTAPLNSINHTDYYPLLRNPIAMSIEVKKNGDRAQDQVLQMSTWQASQWNALSYLIHARLCAGSDEAYDNEEILKKRDALLAELPYLPGLCTHGDSWCITAASREGVMTVLWTDYDIGKTKDLMGVYKIIYGVQCQLQYCREMYWPWFQRAVLGIE